MPQKNIDFQIKNGKKMLEDSDGVNQILSIGTGGICILIPYAM
jgi:hypothetical protein